MTTPEIVFDFDTDPEKRNRVLDEFRRLQQQARETPEPDVPSHITDPEPPSGYWPEDDPDAISPVFVDPTED